MCGVVRGGVVWCVVCGVLECCSIYIVAQWFYFEVKNIVYFYTKTKHLYISIDINVFGGFKMKINIRSKEADFIRMNGILSLFYVFEHRESKNEN